MAGDSSAWAAWNDRRRVSWLCFSASVERARVMTGGEERVDADDRQRAVVLAVLVEHRLVLDATPLVAGLHGAEHPAPLGDALELLEDGLLDEVGELLDDEAALVGVLVHGEPPLLVDDHLDGQGPAHGLVGGGGDGFVEGVGVEAVGIVVEGDQCLEGGADVVEVHLLGVQRSA